MTLIADSVDGTGSVDDQHRAPYAEALRAYGEGPWVRFNIPRFTPTADASVKWVGAQSESGGWKIVPDDHSRFVWYAERIKADGTPQRLRC
jgi:hypothetical protein